MVLHAQRGVAQTAAVGQLRANPWNPNKMDDVMYRKELASIRKFGFVDPVTVREIGLDDYQIIDGEHRWRAAKELGFKELPVFNLGLLDDNTAKQLTIVLNETRGKADPKQLGQILKDLLADTPKTDLLDLLPYSPPIFDRLIGIDTGDWGTPPELPTNSWVERTYRMPKEAADVLDDALAKAKAGEGIADWQALEFLAAEFLSST